MTPPTTHTVAAIEDALASIDLLGVIRQAFVDHHRGLTDAPAESCLRWTAPDGGAARSIAMHARLPGEPMRLGVKVINGAVNNPLRGARRAGGTIALFNALDAQITDLLPAAAISAQRTAAVSTLAARTLAALPVGRLAVLGAGLLADAHVKLLAGSGLGVTELIAFDIDPMRAQALIDRSWVATGHVAATAEEAVRSSDLVLTTTTVTESYVELRWLRPGSLVLNVSLDDLRTDALLGAERLYVDDWQLVRTDRTRRLGRLAVEGKITGPGEPARPRARRVDGELGALLAGAAPGRQAPDERIVFNPFGLAISDIALAAAVCDRLRP